MVTEWEVEKVGVRHGICVGVSGCVHGCERLVTVTFSFM